MRHALATNQLSNVLGYAQQMGVTFKPSKKSPGFVELKSWPKGKTAQEIKDYFKDVLQTPFQLVGETPTP